MFKNPKRKKSYPPGTFIPGPARFLSIIQLSFAFTVFFWNSSVPFLGEMFAYKNHLSVYDTVMGNYEGIANEGLREKIARHKDRFQKLPASERNEVIEGYERVKDAGRASFFDKLKRSMTIALVGIPTFEMAWICLSIIIPIMLLLKLEGAREAVWLLPAVVAIYAVDQALTTSEFRASFENTLFPSEDVIVEGYLKEPLDDDIFVQQQQLKKGWRLYLIDSWVHESPSEDPDIFGDQVERGEHLFYLARAKQLNGHGNVSSYSGKRLSLVMAGIYFLWNLVFTLVVRRYTRPIGSHVSQSA